MKPKKILTLLVLLLTAGITRSGAQIFWSNQSPPGITDDIWCVTFANGTFAAVTNQGNLLTSADGLTWSSQTIDRGVWLVSIAYGNGIWVVVAGEGTILVSSDLKSWTLAASVTSNKLNGVLYAGGQWVAVGDSGTIAASSDAQNWVLQPAIPHVAGFRHGIAWNTGGGGPLPYFTGIPAAVWICGTDGVVVGGAISTAGPTSDVFSGGTIEGLDSLQAPITANLEAILTVPALNSSSAPTFVGAGQGILFYSTIGSLGGPLLHSDYEFFKTSPTAIPNVDFRGLAYGNGSFVAAGEQGTIFTSVDGINWTQRFAGESPATVTTATLLGATFAEALQRFVVVGTEGTILVSNAAPPTVLGNVSTRGSVSNTRTLIGGFVIEGAAPRTVLVRADGPVLSTFGVPSPLPDPVLTVYNSSGTAIATNTGWSTNTNPASISTAALEVGAFALPNLSPESALLLTLQPGAYTAQITSAKGNSGTTLFEAYTD
jgi:hypothetical protein